MTPSVVAAILVTMGLVILTQGIGCAWLYRRVQILTHRFDGQTVEPLRPVDPLIRSLETRLAQLEAVGGAGSDAGGRPNSLSHDAKRGRRLDRRQVALADGPILIAVPSLTPSPSSVSMAAAAVEFDRRFGPIWALADSGISDDEIARQSGYPVGQVELILGLRGAKSSPMRDDGGMALDQDETDA